VFIQVPDPAGMRIGSGGATMNALVALAERYSGLKGLSSVSSNALDDLRVLIIHSGGDSKRSPCQSVVGKAWSFLPSLTVDGDMNAPIDLLLSSLSSVFRNSPPGVVVSCSDVSLILPENISFYNWSRKGFTGLAINAPYLYGPNHGVYTLRGSNQQSVEMFLQKPSIETLEATGSISSEKQVALDSGVVFIDASTSQLLISRFLVAPLDASTALGADRGAKSIRIELYSDLMMPLECSISDKRLFAGAKEDYLVMEDGKSKEIIGARNVLWEDLTGIKMFANNPEGATFAHVGTTKEYVDFVSGKPLYSKFISAYNMNSFTHSYLSKEVKCEGTVINTLLNLSPSIGGSIGKGSVVENCKFFDDTVEFKIGAGCLVSGVRSLRHISLKDNFVMYETTVSVDNSYHGIIAVFGIFDDVKSEFCRKEATFCNSSWDDFLSSNGLNSDDIWGHVLKGESRSLWNARVFPALTYSEDNYDEVMKCLSFLLLTSGDSSEYKSTWLKCKKFSFADISSESAPVYEFDYRQELELDIDCALLKSSLVDKNLNIPLHPICRRASCSQNQFHKVLSIIDEISLSAPLDILARCYTVISDCLALASGSYCSLRAGNAHNTKWPLEMVRTSDDGKAAKAMALERGKWMGSSNLLIRASRHYERAAQIIIAKAVYQSSIVYAPLTVGVIPLHKQIKATCPARVDLAGGWTDTPPLTYEAGGCVLNATMRVDGKCPFTVIIKRITEAKIVLIYASTEIAIESLIDMSDFNQPSAPGALFKCTLIAMDFIKLDSELTFQEQVYQVFKGGLIVTSDSALPAGSGLGGSSILAATLVGALARASGRDYTLDTIVHIVLKIEQILTTGGGWQDQLGTFLIIISY
jgi:fucokinase